MAHVHLEDGAFSPLWVLTWSILAAALIALAIFILNRGRISTRKLAIAAMCTSAGFAVFQISIPVFGGVHINLTPLIGILAGPALGSLSVLVINFFSAVVGHGGWSMIGANTIVNVVEVFFGYYFYRFMRVRLRSERFSSGFVATFIALAAGAALVVLIVAVSGLQDSELTKEETLRNMLPIAAANLAVAAVEGLITGYVVTFIARIRPDLLEEAEGARAKVEEPEVVGA